MKNIFKFIVFIIYTILIFFINDFKILICLLLINLVILGVLKIKFKDMIYNFKIFFPFILFTVILNIIFANLNEGILIGIKIIICYNVTYIFSKRTTTTEIAETIKKLFYPLKIFRVNVDNIGIIVSVSICIIPVLRDEISALTQAMKAKGKLMKVSSILIVMKPMLISILRRTNQMEKCLIAKVYIDDEK